MTPKPRILIVGGYGAFGARAAERLGREADIEIIIAGRSASRAAAAAEDLRKTAKAEIGSASIDATQPDLAALKLLAPAVVINASGPFQAQDYTLARAAIAAGAHYIDLADATDFVLGFARDRELDNAARAAGVLAVSGASSVPAISGAVIDAFAPAFAKLTAVRYGISPGNSFDPGPATTASILGAVGRPFAMKLNGQTRTVHGWQGLSRHTFPGLGKRWMGYCNVPDLHLFAERFPHLQTIDFRAGVEVTLFHLGLWLMSWPSRWGLIRHTERLASPLLAAKGILGFLGTDAGGMFLELDGTDAEGRSKSIAWHLIARSGHGPYIPTTPAIILARKLARGETLEPGARACVGLVTLAEIERELGDLDITMRQSTALYRRLLGPKFDMLPTRVRDLHDVNAETRWTGRADVTRGPSWLARSLAAVLSLPPQGPDQPLSVTFTPKDGAEIWTRSFGAKKFVSVQSVQSAVLHEKVGPITLIMSLHASADGLSLAMISARALGLPVPTALLPKISTREYAEAGRYRFEVEAVMPVIGLLVRYSGWLERDAR